MLMQDVRWMMPSHSNRSNESILWSQKNPNPEEIHNNRSILIFIIIDTKRNKQTNSRYFKLSLISAYSICPVKCITYMYVCTCIHTKVSIFMFLNHRSFGETPKIIWKSFGTFNLRILKGLLKHEKTPKKQRWNTGGW